MLHKPIYRDLEENDTEARKAVRDAIPVVVHLTTARQRQLPKNVEQARLRSEEIADQEQTLALIASRGGWDPAELEQVARAEAGVTIARMEKPQPVEPEAPAPAPPSQTDLLLELGKAEAELAAMVREHDALGAKIDAHRKATARLRRRAFAFRRPAR